MSIDGLEVSVAALREIGERAEIVVCENGSRRVETSPFLRPEIALRACNIGRETAGLHPLSMDEFIDKNLDHGYPGTIEWLRRFGFR